MSYICYVQVKIITWLSLALNHFALPSVIVDSKSADDIGKDVHLTCTCKSCDFHMILASLDSELVCGIVLKLLSQHMDVVLE